MSIFYRSKYHNNIKYFVRQEISECFFLLFLICFLFAAVIVFCTVSFSLKKLKKNSEKEYLEEYF